VICELANDDGTVMKGEQIVRFAAKPRSQARLGRRSHRLPAGPREAGRASREIGLGAQILRDLGISSIKLFASRKRHYVGLQGFGIEIADTEIIER
jgi:3,4-dihydroxy 2-butanone 4-phosphate synthase / GTP cyclohydrolase II